MSLSERRISNAEHAVRRGMCLHSGHCAELFYEHTLTGEIGCGGQIRQGKLPACDEK